MTTTSDGEPLSPLLLPAMFAGELELEMPEAPQLLETALGKLRFPVSYILGSDSLAPAVAMITNQAVNDFIDLAYDLLTLRGRPVLRATRSLFELLVSLLDVTTDPDAAERYEEHRHIAALVRAEAVLGLDALPPAEARAERRAITKAVSESRSSANAALAKYGAGYRSRWASASLADRAAAHGLGGEYAFYRLASMLLHGTAGGTHGTMSYSIGPNPVHRTGPNLQGCWPAWFNGVRFFDSIVAALGEAVRGVDVRELRAALADLLSAWPRYYSAVQTIDERTWPVEPLHNDIAILAVSRRGKLRWLLLDTRTNDILQAQAPSKADLSAEQWDRVTALVERVTGNPDRLDDWVTIALAGVRLNPVAGAKRFPATAYLVPKSDPRFRSEPKTITDIDDIE